MIWRKFEALWLGLGMTKVFFLEFSYLQVRNIHKLYMLLR